MKPKDAWKAYKEKIRPFEELTERLREITKSAHLKETERERVVKFRIREGEDTYQYTLVYTEEGKLKEMSYEMVRFDIITKPHIDRFRELYETGEVEKECWRTLKKATEGIEIFTIK